ASGTTHGCRSGVGCGRGAIIGGVKENLGNWPFEAGVGVFLPPPPPPPARSLALGISTCCILKSSGLTMWISTTWSFPAALALACTHHRIKIVAKNTAYTTTPVERPNLNSILRRWPPSPSPLNAVLI